MVITLIRELGKREHMKVKELIDELQKLNGERIVILQGDAEGNNYSPISGIRTGAWRATVTWYGEVDEDFTEGEPAVILRPIN